MNENILLECQNVVMGYDGAAVVNSVSFELERGDYLCIVGENGSGKSTLLKGILGLIPLRGGSVGFLDGLKRTDIGYLPQQTQAQRDFPATVREVVLSGCLNGSRGPFYSRADRNLANKNMEKLSITDIARRSYRELSGGQQQRVLLARALCAAKELLLLDTIPYPADRQPSDKIKYMSVAPVFAEAIQRVYEEMSISNLFE